MIRVYQQPRTHESLVSVANGSFEEASTSHSSRSSVSSSTTNAPNELEDDLSSIDNEMPAPTTIPGPSLEIF